METYEEVHHLRNTAGTLLSSLVRISCKNFKCSHSSILPTSEQLDSRPQEVTWLLKEHTDHTTIIKPVGRLFSYLFISLLPLLPPLWGYVVVPWFGIKKFTGYSWQGHTRRRATRLLRNLLKGQITQLIEKKRNKIFGLSYFKKTTW